MRLTYRQLDGRAKRGLARRARPLFAPFQPREAGLKWRNRIHVKSEVNLALKRSDDKSSRLIDAPH
jgi:hypothetical protein